jgi:hypothetical protein
MGVSLLILKFKFQTITSVRQNVLDMYWSYKQFPELAGLDPETAKLRYEAVKSDVVKNYRVRFGIATAISAVVGRVLFGNTGFAVGIGLAIGIGGYLMNLKIREQLKTMQ